MMAIWKNVHLEVISVLKYDGICVGLHIHQCGVWQRSLDSIRAKGIEDSRKNAHLEVISVLKYVGICVGLHTHQCGVWKRSLDPVCSQGIEDVPKLRIPALCFHAETKFMRIGFFLWKRLELILQHLN